MPGGWPHPVLSRLCDFAAAVQGVSRRRKRLPPTRSLQPRRRSFISEWVLRIIGGSDTVRAGLAELVERTGADELMITTMTYAHADRVRSYELVAEALELDGPRSEPAGQHVHARTG